MTNITDHWRNLDANKKRGIALGTSLLVIVSILYAIVSVEKPVTKSKGQRSEVTDVFMGSRGEELQRDAVAGQLAKFQDQMKKMADQLDNTVSTAERRYAMQRQRSEEKSAQLRNEMTLQIQSLQQKINEQETLINEYQSNPDKKIVSHVLPADGKSVETNPNKDTGVKTVRPDELGWEKMIEDSKIVDPPFTAENSAIPPGAVKNGAGKSPGEQSQLEIFVYEDEVEHEDSTDVKAEELATETALAAGSIISGTLITGLDAPTSSQTKRDPFPVVLRVKHEAIGPNFYTSDIRECFIISSGYGDLSSERVYLRAETLSCITEDGKLAEGKLNAFSVGEDGKNGVRGRVVTRNGQLIANSMLAGFGAGLSDIFRPTAISNINTSPDQDTLFQQPDTREALKAGAFGGASSALEKIAEYWLEMADSIHPIIEIDAGRKVEFVVIGTSRLKVAKN